MTSNFLETNETNELNLKQRYNIIIMYNTRMLRNLKYTTQKDIVFMVFVLKSGLTINFNLCKKKKNKFIGRFFIHLFVVKENLM